MRLNRSGPLNDLHGIDDYLSEFRRGIASHRLRAIQTAADRLADLPGVGPALEADARSLRIRSTPHALLYRIEKAGISLLRIHHDRQHWRVDGPAA